MSNSTEHISVVADGDITTLSFDNKCRVKYLTLNKLYNDWIKGYIKLEDDAGSNSTVKMDETDVANFVKFYSGIDVEFRPRVNTKHIDKQNIYIRSTFLMSLFEQWVELHKGLDSTTSTKLDTIMVALLSVSDEYRNNKTIMFGFGYTA
jgi:hypothetical protein